MRSLEHSDRSTEQKVKKCEGENTLKTLFVALTFAPCLINNFAMSAPLLLLAATSRAVPPLWFST